MYNTLNLQANLFATVGGWFKFKNPQLGGIIIFITLILLVAFIVVATIFIKRKAKLKKQVVENNSQDQKPTCEQQTATQQPEQNIDFQPDQPVVNQNIQKPSANTDKKQEEIKQDEVEVQEKEQSVEQQVEEKQASQQEQPPVKQKKLSGKWVIEKKGEEEYISVLLASNGELMLTSETYSSEEGARNGVATILRGIDNGTFVIYEDKNKNYYCKLKSSNNKLLCAGEIYSTRANCVTAVDSIKHFAKESSIQKEVVIGTKYIEYTPAPLNITDIKKGTEGKWKVEKVDGNYSARLYASNGQLMLATEQVANIKNARNGIEAVKKNAEQANFIIDQDKSGRYYYKLRNWQKSVICIGEAYDSLDSCLKAIESVRRFALTAIVAEE